MLIKEIKGRYKEMYADNEWKASQFNEFLGEINNNWILYNLNRE